MIIPNKDRLVLEHLQEAAREWLDRKSGTKRPDSVFVRNQNGAGPQYVWHPTTNEMRSCCLPVAFSQRYNHCKTAKHVAVLFGVSEKDLRKAAQQLEENHDHIEA
jgi:hypothetical protein